MYRFNLVSNKVYNLLRIYLDSLFRLVLTRLQYINNFKFSAPSDRFQVSGEGMADRESPLMVTKIE